MNLRFTGLHSQGTPNLATSECAPTSKQYSCVVSRPINAIKLRHLFVMKYIYSKCVLCARSGLYSFVSVT